LNSAVANAFDIGVKGQKTRSVIVIHKDRIIAEKYDMVLIKTVKFWLVDDHITPPFWNT
jgi:hypothetical protein